MALDADLANLDLLGHSDIGGRSDGLQVVGFDNRVFVSHLFGNGFSEVDISDPRQPRVLSFTPAPPGSWSLHLQVQDGLLLATNAPDLWSQFAAQAAGLPAPEVEPACGVRIYDVATPGSPHQIGWFEVGGGGVHRIWYAGGTRALLSAAPPEEKGTMLMVLDLSDPVRPAELDRWTMPPSVDQTRNLTLHHAIERDGVVYGAWRDGGMSIHHLTVAGRLELQSVLVWDGPGGAGAAVHSTVPLSGRPLVAVAEEGLEEQGEAQERRVLLVDSTDLTAPRRASALPEPGVTPVPGGRFGPHNLYEYRPGAWQDPNRLFVAHQGAGLCVYDVSDATAAHEVAHFRPAGPTGFRDPRPGRASVCQTNDVFVTDGGLVCTVDTNLGLHTLQLR